MQAQASARACTHVAAPARAAGLLQLLCGLLLRVRAGPGAACAPCAAHRDLRSFFLQDKIAAAERLRDAGLAFSDGTASMEDAASVLDMVESVVSTVSDLVGAAKKGERDKPVDVQALVLPRRTGAEQALAKYLALGQVLISLSAKAMEAMPFGAPAAAMLGAVYGRAAQVGACAPRLPGAVPAAACGRPQLQWRTRPAARLCGCVGSCKGTHTACRRRPRRAGTASCCWH